MIPGALVVAPLTERIDEKKKSGRSKDSMSLKAPRLCCTMVNQSGRERNGTEVGIWVHVAEAAVPGHLNIYKRDA